MNSEQKDEIHKLFLKLLVEFEDASRLVISEFSTNIVQETEELERDVQDYKEQIEKLLEGRH